jgi:alanine dehydrogenase
MTHDTPHEILVISGADVRRLLTMAQCIELMHRTMRAVSLGKAQLPLRIGARIPGGNVLATMPGYLEEPLAAGAKIIAVFPENNRQGLPSHQGIVVLFDTANGVPLAVIDATAITALRTAAASAVATRVLAREDAHTLAILGSGEQAREHLIALRHVRPIQNVIVWGRTHRRAAAFADRESSRLGIKIDVANTAQEAVRDADLICTTTSSHEPILDGAWVKPGAHVNLVGASSILAREGNDALIAKGTLFVDYRESALAQAAELRTPNGQVDGARIRGEIGEVLASRVPGRTTRDEITIYKSLGIAAQDLAAAEFVFSLASETSSGTRARI